MKTQYISARCESASLHLLSGMVFLMVMIVPLSAFSQEKKEEKARKERLRSLASSFQEEARGYGFTPRDIIESVLEYSYNPKDQPQRDHQAFIRRKAERDSIFQSLCYGVIDMQKTSYKSRADDMEIPVYIFQPLKKRGLNGHPALLWIHGGIHGDLTPNYFPFFKEAVDRGYVIVSPEYRGSTGYGAEHYNAIDYGGYEVDDCLTAVNFIRENLPHVDTGRIGVIGRSHGGFLTLHSLFREPGSLKCGVAIVPVTNLIIRLAYKGPRFQLYHMTQPRVLGLPHDRFEIYKERSPYYNVEKLEIPLLVHVADNDGDVYFEEAEMLIHKFLVKKPHLVETRIYHNPPGAHSFDMHVNRETWTRKDTKEQRDSWNRVWTFLELHLEPYRGN